jgi:hypothetical protein
VSEAFIDITPANFSSATEIGWMRTEFFGLMRITCSGVVGTSFWATVSFGALFNTAVANAWHAFVVVLVPSITRIFQVSEMVNTLSATVFVWDALFNFTAATGID